MEKEMIKNAMEVNDYSTAVGRNTADGTEIRPPERELHKKEHARERADVYERVMCMLKMEIAQIFDGVDEGNELEALEFVMEQLVQLEKIAHNKYITERRKELPPDVHNGDKTVDTSRCNRCY